MQVLLVKQLGQNFLDSHEVLSIETIEDNNKLQGFYDLIGCRTIEMPDVEIDGHWYCAVCDEEGLLVNAPVPTLYINDEQVLFGNLVFCRIDEEGDSASLEHEDFARIGAFIRDQKTKMDRWKLSILARRRG